ncbi:tRNA (adenosine(37)-N6)-dimethylallyltransferase MiaA [Brevundimonas sp.]|uniref:tRNA (adenosine(37)-N6)-dimethylallyltransferase MiaA n=1 Tax=Brevundimonas sp. TaxID=1871086 RepID=UPI002ABB276E|nr:tRNA (adenosine(37)-N6)-dimethylallyltransferase MiaA [Brevundimonas sp.]MDZ4365123.1 tRNA (adenosine(37)-N6)-dimethylallyltransferase MiaA [Brevundimonas sp.]
MSSAAPVTLIAGPTASGKSALALDLARRTGALIVNADSQQLYADLRVLTARPSIADEALADHALYGHVDGAEAWSVGRWVRAVQPLLDQAIGGGRPVVLVGGTGLYFHALTRGLADIPAVDDATRDAATALYDQEGETAFRARLGRIDARAATVLAANDRQRMTRAFAVHAQTGRSLSDWQADTVPILAAEHYRALVIEPDREVLYARCDARVGDMVDGGALDEVAALTARRLSSSLPVMKAVGVRELAAHLSGQTPLQTALDAMRQATRNYAKRQLTWFRNQTPDWPRTANNDA